ncbi:MAG TPA: hypothetical protein VJ725_04770 [Thermoanaerobaculia bacterium]|nr:hypothetical protein [Thermoanaerobaculia bacterium]
MGNETAGLGLPLMFLALFPFLFVGIWAGVVLLLSWVGGWRALAGSYRAAQPFTGEQFRARVGWMRGARYRGVLSLGADSMGLHLSVFPLFRMGHPSLFIPWSDISFAKDRYGFFEGVRLRFSKVPSASLLIPTELAAMVFAKGPIRFEAA